MDSGNISKLSSISDFDSLKDQTILIVYFYVSYCPTSILMSPAFQKLAQKFSSDFVAFATCEKEEGSKVWESNGILTCPAFLVFNHGKKVDELIGAFPKRLEELVCRHAKPTGQKVEVTSQMDVSYFL